ncbi:MAG: hypothetical protein WC755_02580 [Candidatus Woesearchaeota archaeon]|jgi:hypothetical protein
MNVEYLANFGSVVANDIKKNLSFFSFYNKNYIKKLSLYRDILQNYFRFDKSDIADSVKKINEMKNILTLFIEQNPTSNNFVFKVKNSLMSCSMSDSEKDLFSNIQSPTFVSLERVLSLQYSYLLYMITEESISKPDTVHIKMHQVFSNFKNLLVEEGKLISFEESTLTQIEDILHVNALSFTRENYDVVSRKFIEKLYSLFLEFGLKDFMIKNIGSTSRPSYQMNGSVFRSDFDLIVCLSDEDFSFLLTLSPTLDIFDKFLKEKLGIVMTSSINSSIFGKVNRNYFITHDFSISVMPEIKGTKVDIMFCSKDYFDAHSTNSVLLDTMLKDLSKKELTAYRDDLTYMKKRLRIISPQKQIKPVAVESILIRLNLKQLFRAFVYGYNKTDKGIYIPPNIVTDCIINSCFEVSHGSFYFKQNLLEQFIKTIDDLGVPKFLETKKHLCKQSVYGFLVMAYYYLLGDKEHLITFDDYCHFANLHGCNIKVLSKNSLPDNLGINETDIVNSFIKKLFIYNQSEIVDFYVNYSVKEIYITLKDRYPGKYVINGTWNISDVKYLVESSFTSMVAISAKSRPHIIQLFDDIGDIKE